MNRGIKPVSLKGQSMKQVKIKYLTVVPGMGGINYDYLYSIGWTPETLCSVLREDLNGCWVKIPNEEKEVFLYSKEIEEIQEKP